MNTAVTQFQRATMKFKTTDGDVVITNVELTNDDDGQTFLIFDFDNKRREIIPCTLNIDYLTVVRKLIKK